MKVRSGSDFWVQTTTFPLLLAVAGSPLPPPMINFFPWIQTQRTVMGEFLFPNQTISQ
ncbi:hypothetical protein LINGRAHAP2_LOCUS9110 [Linum grandiflorum]